MLDPYAFAVVIGAGHFVKSEFDTFASSTSGVMVIILGRFFLKERLAPLQWRAVMAVFGVVAFLGFQMWWLIVGEPHCADIAQISISLCIVYAITNNKPVGYFESGPICFN